MSRLRYEITGRLTNVTPLHVGSGEFRKIGSVSGKDGANEPPDVAAIVRDATDKPFIPGSTLKGLLRRIGERLFDEKNRTDRLFRTIKGESGGPIRVFIFVRGAALAKAPPAFPDAPYAPGDDLGEGVFVAARTSIDPQSGAAGDHKLFFQELVAPGAEFGLRLLLEFSREIGRSYAEEVLRDLVRVLDCLSRDGGAVGKGQADGAGLLRLDADSVAIARCTLDEDGAFAKARADEVWTERDHIDAPAPIWDFEFELFCDGPFAVIDSSRLRKPKADDESHEPQIKAQRLTKDLPLLLGSSLSGALRARAEWLKQLEAVGAGKTPRRDDRDRVVKSRQDIGGLDAVERLFGVTGFRGLLTIRDLEITGAPTLLPITSVKLDRFSGAPMHNNLFTTEVFVGVGVKFRLTLDKRGKTTPSETDVGLAERLAADIKRNGLTLGHGGAKGFGWFEAARA